MGGSRGKSKTQRGPPDRGRALPSSPRLSQAPPPAHWTRTLGGPVDPWPSSALDKTSPNGRGSEWQASRCTLAQCEGGHQAQVERRALPLLSSGLPWFCPVPANHCRVLLQLTCRCRKPCSGPGDAPRRAWCGAVPGEPGQPYTDRAGQQESGRPERLGCSQGVVNGRDEYRSTLDFPRLSVASPYP